MFVFSLKFTSDVVKKRSNFDTFWELKKTNPAKRLEYYYLDITSKIYIITVTYIMPAAKCSYITIVCER